MLNKADRLPDDVPSVLDYANPVVAKAMASGVVNTSDEGLLANVRRAIRRGHPQMRPGPARPERVCLVGGGVSLAETEADLRALYFEGALVVTLNGAYHWCRERNIRPSTQIVMDARASNARFVTPYVPRCRYVLASQCAPETWDAVADYPDVWIWHAATASSALAEELDAFYAEKWYGVGGGTTVATRALSLLTLAGWRRFDLFGIDSCWLDGAHHAYPQPENEADQRIALTVARGETARTFELAPWHLKQFEDVLQMIRVNGDVFQLAVHGRGLLAYALEALGSEDVSFSVKEKADGRTGVQVLQRGEEEDRQHDAESGLDRVPDHAAHVGV